MLNAKYEDSNFNRQNSILKLLDNIEAKYHFQDQEKHLDVLFVEFIVKTRTANTSNTTIHTNSSASTSNNCMNNQ